jgi:hypothetical protein
MSHPQLLQSALSADDLSGPRQPVSGLRVEIATRDRRDWKKHRNGDSASLRNTIFIVGKKDEKGEQAGKDGDSTASQLPHLRALAQFLALDEQFHWPRISRVQGKPVDFRVYAINVVTH